MRPGPITIALAALAFATGAAKPGGNTLPPVVFVSRHPAPGGDPSVIPGLGPRGRALATGGRLLVRERGGAVRELLPAGMLYDASDPCVSPDGRRVAFAGTTGADSAWRIWSVGLDGGRARRVTGGSAGARFDDFDPCWVNDSTLCFASTRYPQVAQYGGVPASNLFLIALGSGAIARLTSERNGAEEPAMDFRRGRIVFSRWWHNRWRAARDSAGPTTDPARAASSDTVNLWAAMEITAAGTGERLACGSPPSRLGAMAYQPALLDDGSIAAVYAANLGLFPASGGTGIQRFAPRLAAGRRLVGAIADPHARAGYGSPSGLAPASACSPAALPDGRVLFAWDPGGRGDFGIYVMRADGSAIERVVDLPGTLELDPAPVVIQTTRARATRPIAPPIPAPAAAGPPALPFTTLDQVLAHPRRFRYLDLGVFGPPGPAAEPGARIRFYAALARPESPGGDTIALVREAAVGPRGRVDQAGLPADVPMFEEVVDRSGRALRAAHGEAHVAGLNIGPAGGVSRCAGCHVGHSTRLRDR